MVGHSNRKLLEQDANMEIIIREAQQNDALTIASFQQKMAMETENKLLDPEVVTQAVRAVFDDSSKGFYLVAELDSQVVGSLMVTYEWSDWRNCNMWYIQSVYVLRDYRGQGVFTELYARIVELASEAGTMFVRLYVEVDNKRAQKLYEKLGMKRMPYYMYDMKI